MLVTLFTGTCLQETPVGSTPSAAVLMPQEDLGMREAANGQIPCLRLTQRSCQLCMKVKALLKVQMASFLSELNSHSGAFAWQSQHFRTTIQSGRTARDPHTACQRPEPALTFLHQICQRENRSNHGMGKAAAGKEAPLLMEAPWKQEG